MPNQVCRWGILSTASISKKNWKAIWKAENAIVTAVASRQKEKAETYISELQAHTPFDSTPRAIGGYDELLADNQVDAVYIPLPTTLRKEWVIKAAEAGKHVLCEKPCGCTASDLQEMIDACAKHNVQFMDGVMFMHSERLRDMRATLDDGESVGQIRRIAAQFSFNGGDEFEASNIRTNGDLEPLGCLGDLGWYPIRFILWAMNWQLPHSVCGRLLQDLKRDNSSTAVPMEFSGELFFTGGTSASFYCSFVSELQQWCVISGEKGYLQVDDFVLPYFGSRLQFQVCKADFTTTGCDFNMEDQTSIHTTHEYSNSDKSAQESGMIRCFSNLVIQREPDPFWPKVAMDTQVVLDQCLASARNGGALIETTL